MRLRPIKMAKERHDCGTREKLANAQTVPRVFRILSLLFLTPFSRGRRQVGSVYFIFSAACALLKMAP